LILTGLRLLVVVLYYLVILLVCWYGLAGLGMQLLTWWLSLTNSLSLLVGQGPGLMRNYRTAHQKLTSRVYHHLLVRYIRYTRG